MTFWISHGVCRFGPCYIIYIQFSKHWPSGPMPKCPSVCLSVRLSVCLSVCSLVRYRSTVFLPPLPEVGCPIFLEIRNPWGKSNGKKWSQIWTFLFESCLKLPRKKKVFFCWFCLTKHGGNFASQWIRDLWSKGLLLILTYLAFCVLDDFFHFQKNRVLGYSWSTRKPLFPKD